jgi:hypothetical protein
VAARKNRPVLYEVARLSRRQRDAGWKRRSVSPAPESTPAEGVPTPGGSADSAVPGRARGFRFVKRRFWLNLGWPGLLGAAGVIVVVLWLAYAFGLKLTGSQAPTRATSPGGHTAGKLPTPGGAPAPDHRPAPGESVVTPNQPSPTTRPAAAEHSAEPPAPAAEAFTWKPGYHYIVIQHFRKSEEEAAKEAYRFLEANKVPAVITRGADFQLIAREPFLLKQDDAQARAAEDKRCEDLKRRIKELGKEYAKRQRAAKKPEYTFDQADGKIMKR